MLFFCFRAGVDFLKLEGHGHDIYRNRWDLGGLGLLILKLREFESIALFLVNIRIGFSILGERRM
jgi:hypothetical protein